MSGLLGPLRIGPGDVVAVVGAGGKTTLVYRLAAEARSGGMRVLVTTTTHMGTLPEVTTGPVFVEAEGDPRPALTRALAQGGLATLLGRRVRSDKLEGIAPRRVDELARAADLVLVEADGARGRSLKTPAEHEPVVPGSTTLLLVVAALDVLGQDLAEGHVHRVALVAAASGRAPGSTVDEDVVVSVLRDPSGYLSRVPPSARAGVFLNKAEGEAAGAAAARIARRLVPPYAFVAAGSARAGAASDVTGTPAHTMASVVLAAGASARMGRPKMLLPVGGTTLLASVVAPHLAAGVGRVVVVLGNEAEAVRRSAGLPDDPRLRIIVNADWGRGMASSLQAGLEECGTAEAALVALGDQPGVTAERVRRIVEAWRPGVPLVVPVHEGRAGHPVLFARSVWRELEALTGDVGARDVVRRHAADAVRVELPAVADLDTPAEYEDHLRGRGPRGPRGLKLPPP